MRPRPVVAFVVTMLLAAACGDPEATKPAAPPTSAAPITSASEGAEATVPSTGGGDATVSEPVTTIAAEVTNPSVVDGVSFDTTMSTDGLMSYDTLPQTQSTMFEGDVSIEDPLPEQADALTDPSLAETDVRYAYQHWILIDLDKDVRGRLVENGELNADRMAATMEANRGLITCARIVVDLVQFTDAEHALVEFDMNCGTARSSYFPNQLSGSALYQNGTWRISGATLCLLAFGSGIDCAGAAATDNPVSPTAFELTIVPNGYTWAGGPVANVFASDGFAQWENSATHQTLTINTEALAGVSKLGPADVDFVLSSPRFRTAGGSAVLVGDRPGLGKQDGATASLAYLRADDVIIHIWGSDSTVEQLVAVAAAIVPTDAVPSAPNDTTIVHLDPETGSLNTFETGD